MQPKKASGSRKSSISSQMRPSLAPTIKMTPRKSSLTPTEKMISPSGSRKSSLTPSEKKGSKTKSSMNLFSAVEEENNLTLKSLTKLLKNLGIKPEAGKKSAGKSFEDLSKKGFRTKK